MEEDLDFDIYGNLPEDDVNFEEEISKLQEKVHQQEAHIVTLECNVEKLTVNISEMKGILDNLKKNISELYKTARAEIDRKDRLISELRGQVDRFTLEKKMGFSNKRPRDSVNSHEFGIVAKRPKREYDNIRRSRSRDKIKSRSRSRSRERYKDKNKVKEQSRYKSKKEHRSNRDKDRNEGSKEGESKSKNKDNKNEGEKQKRRNEGYPDIEVKLTELFFVEEKTVSKKPVDNSEKIQRLKCLTDSEKINQKLFKNVPKVNITRQEDLERALITTEKAKVERQDEVETQVTIVKKEHVKKDSSKTKLEKKSVESVRADKGVDRKIEKEAKRIEERNAQKKIGVKKEGERKNNVKEELGRNKHDVNENKEKDTKEDREVQRVLINPTVEESEKKKASEGKNIEMNAILDITDRTKDHSKKKNQTERNVRTVKTDETKSKNESQDDEKNTDDGNKEEISENEAMLEEKKKTTDIVKTDVTSQIISPQKEEENKKESTIDNHLIELESDENLNMKDADKTENCLVESTQKKITDAKCNHQAADDPTDVGINKKQISNVNKVKKSAEKVRPNKPKIEEVTKKLKAKWGEEGNVDNSCAIVTLSDCQIDKKLLDVVRNAAFAEEEDNRGTDLIAANSTETNINSLEEERKIANSNLPVVNQTEEEIEEGEIIDKRRESHLADTLQKKIKSVGTGGAVIGDKRSVMDKSQKKCLTVREDEIRLKTNAAKKDCKNTDDIYRRLNKGVMDDQRKDANLADKHQKKSNDNLKAKENLEAKTVTIKKFKGNTEVLSKLKEGVKIIDDQRIDAVLAQNSQKRCNDDLKVTEIEVNLNSKAITKINDTANTDLKSKNLKEGEKIMEVQRNHAEKSKKKCNDDLSVKENEESKATKKDFNAGADTKSKKLKEANRPEDSPTESGRVLRSATRRNSNKDKSDNCIFDQENRQRLLSPPNSVTLTHEGDIPVLHIPDSSHGYLFDSNSTSTPLKERFSVDIQLLKDDLSISLDASGIEDGRPCHNNSVVWNTSSKSNTSGNSSNSSARKRRKVTLTLID